MGRACRALQPPFQKPSGILTCKRLILRHRNRPFSPYQKQVLLEGAGRWQPEQAPIALGQKGSEYDLSKPNETHGRIFPIRLFQKVWVMRQHKPVDFLWQCIPCTATAAMHDEVRLPQQLPEVRLQSVPTRAG